MLEKLRRKWWIGVVLVTIPLIIGCGRFHKKHEFTQENLTKFIEKISDKLDLTETQLETFNKIGEEILAEHKKVDLKKMKDEIIAQIKSNNFDVEKAKEFANEMSQKKLLLIEKFGTLHKVLNDEQKNKIAEFIEDHFQ